MGKKSLDLIYKERTEFIIIGFTGRTGSGCSTAADILKSENFEDLRLPKPQTSNFTSNDERKYKIIYDYLSLNWEHFETISIKNIITSFILEVDYNKLINYLEHYLQEKPIINPKLEEEYESLKKQNKKCLKLLYKLKKCNDKEKESLTKFYYEDLNEVSKKLKNIIDNSFNTKPQGIYRQIGNNIRSSGDATDSNYDSKCLFSIAERINKIIKLLRAKRRAFPFSTLHFKLCLENLGLPLASLN